MRDTRSKGRLRAALFVCESRPILYSEQQLYAKDAARFNALSLRLTETQVALMQAEEEWLALELLREEVEGA